MPDLPDSLIVIGALAMVIGVALYSIPAAVVLGGVLMLLFGLTAAGRRNGSSG